MTDLSKANDTDTIKPDIALAERLFTEFYTRTSDVRGVTRISYGLGENIAHSIIRREAEALGLAIKSDPACNQYITLPGQSDGPEIVIGSHLDSVPMGGNFDGAAGVLMGLSIISGFVSSRRLPILPITLMVIRAEESAWFAASYIGSRASFGQLSAQELETVIRAGDGEKLGDAIQAAGGCISEIAKGYSHWSPGDIALFLEPHIEQGPILAQKNIPLGIVTDIRGSLRFRQAICRGTYAHSGATPREARRDAALAVCKLVVEIDQLWRQFEARGKDLTVTVGEIATDPNEASFSKVAGSVRFSLDIRSNSRAILKAFAVDLQVLTRAIEKDENVILDLGPRTSTESAKMHSSIVSRLDQAATEIKVPILKMPCGAGHDAATFANLGVPTGMLFLRNENGSHNPDEYMSLSDFSDGAKLLMRFCMQPPDIAK